MVWKVMSFRSRPSVTTWEQVVALHEQPGEISSATTDIGERLLLAGIETERKVFLITSAVEAEGKTTLVLHLGAALATKGKRVLLVDVHRRRPELSRVFGLSGRPGVAELVGPDAPDGPSENPVVQDDRLPGLFVLPNGGASSGFFDRRSGDRLASFLQQVGRDFDFVFLDAAPIASGSEALVLNRVVDGVVLVVACDRTQQPNLVSARHAIESHAGDLVGVVLSRVPAYLPGYYRNS